MKDQTFEDVSPIINGDVPLPAMLVFRGARQQKLFPPRPFFVAFEASKR